MISYQARLTNRSVDKEVESVWRGSIKVEVYHIIWMQFETKCLQWLLLGIKPLRQFVVMSDMYDLLLSHYPRSTISPVFTASQLRFRR